MKLFGQSPVVAQTNGIRPVLDPEWTVCAFQEKEKNFFGVFFFLETSFHLLTQPCHPYFTVQKVPEEGHGKYWFALLCFIMKFY